MFSLEGDNHHKSRRAEGNEETQVAANIVSNFGEVNIKLFRMVETFDGNLHWMVDDLRLKTTPNGRQPFMEHNF